MCISATRPYNILPGPLPEETHYYPFGLAMAGISSKAAGRLENRRKFNAIELNNDLELNQYDAHFRSLDPQIGRFLQIDPEADRLVSYSVYESMGNNPISNVDPLGNFRTRFGAWLHSVFNGGSVHKNRYDEWYVLKAETCIDENGRVETIAHVNYGKGRDAYSTAREKLDDDYAGITVEDDLAKMRIWDPNISQKEGIKNLINMSLALIVPNFNPKIPAPPNKTPPKLLNQFNSVESLIEKAIPKVSSILKHGELQGFIISGNGEAIFAAITKGGKLLPNKMSVMLENGTIVTKYFSTTTGEFTIQINMIEVIYKIRIIQ